MARRRELGDARFLAIGLENLGVTLRELKRDAEARVVYEEALAGYRAAGRADEAAGVLTNLGALAGDEGRFDEALAFYEEALRYDRADGYRPGEAILLRNIGATLRRAGRAGEALRWLDEAVELAGALNDPGRIASARLERAEAREAAGDEAGALADLRAALAARQRAETAARETELLEQQTRFETVEKEREIAELEREAAERELGLARSEAARAAELMRGRAALGGAVAAGGAAVLLAGLLRAKQRTARRLAQQRAELAEALGELRAAHGELKRLYARKSEWLGFAVHELRSPLFGIDGCCAEIETGLAESPTATVGQIREAAARMRRDLDVWLDAERREQTEFVLQRVPADLGRLAGEVVELSQSPARAKSIALRHVAESVARAEVDPWRWREIVDNLVSNALKFSPPGRSVTVRTGATAERAWCRVEDEGPGLREEDHAKLFAAFAQLSARPTAGEKSTGLGLHGVKRLVEAHGGEIKASNAAGGGAVFEVSVPVAGGRGEAVA